MENNSIEQSQQANAGKAVYQQFGPDEQPNKLKKTLEFMIYAVGFLGTIFALVQGYKIWFLGDIGGTSIISWVALAAFTPFWILYGTVHKKKSLVMTYVIWLVINLLVIVGLMMKG